MAIPIYATVLSQINTYIVANGNNEITANVLNPILKLMLDFSNNNIGDLETLTTDEKNSIVEAINSLKQNFDDLVNNGVQLYTGINDPNVTPPPAYNYADFYMQLDIDNLPVKLWQWNGFVWTDESEEPETESDNVLNNSIVPGVTVTDAFNNLIENTNIKWGYVTAVNGGTRIIAPDEDILSVDGSAVTNYTITLPALTEAKEVSVTFNASVTNLTINSGGVIDYLPPKAKSYDTYTWVYEPIGNQWILKSYWSGDLGTQITALPNKSTLVDADISVISDSANSSASKKFSLLNLWNYIKVKIDLIFQTKLSWKTPQDYGAIGDGVTDDTVAIRACFASNNNILLYGEYKVTDFIEILDNQFIFSNNAIIKRTLAGSSSIFGSINRFGFQITGKLTLEGDGDGSTIGSAAGISLAGCDGFYLDGITIKNIKGIGLNINPGADVMPRGDGARISNLQFIQNYIGVNTGYSHQAEYHSFININATECGTGLKIQGGNISFSGGNIVDNNIGVYIGGTLGTNNSHGILSGMNINHNTLNLRVENADLGQSISACHFYGEASSNIEIINSKGFIFNNCIISGEVSNSDSITPKGTHFFSNCLIEDSTTFTGNSVLIKDCITPTGLEYSGNNYDWGLNGNKYMYAGDIGKRFAYVSSSANILYSGGVGGFGINDQSDANRILDLSDSGVLKLPSLAGTGTRTVVADASGNLSATSTPPDSRPYKVYTALLQQSGTSAPVATILENTLGGSIVWSYVAIGVYDGTLSSAFTSSKTASFLNIGQVTGTTSAKWGIFPNSTSGMRIITNNNGTATDGILSTATVEIRVYN